MAPRRSRLPRAPHRALGRALTGALVAVLLLTGCAGGADDGPTKAGKTSGGSSTASPSAGGPTEKPSPPPEPTYGMPKAGRCFQLSARQSRAPVATGRRVRCQAPHTSVVAYAGLVAGAVTAQTPLARRRAVAARVCNRAFNRVVGGTPADRATSLLRWVFFTPSAAQLERGARWVRCDVVARSGRLLVPLATTVPLLSAGVPENLRVCQTARGVDVSCTRGHAFRVEAVYRETAPAYPAPKAYTPVARDRCKELMQGYGGFWQPPSRLGWRRGDRFIRCLKQDT